MLLLEEIVNMEVVDLLVQKMLHAYVVATVSKNPKVENLMNINIVVNYNSSVVISVVIIVRIIFIYSFLF